MIAVIDYGMGNLRSVEKALEKLGADVEVISDPERLSLSDKVVLPGVGAFKDTMEGIEDRGLKEIICEFISSGKPYLGICMGLQILFDESQEGGLYKGLGILKGKVKRFRAKRGLKVPHMGWNQLKVQDGRMKRNGDCPLLKSIPDSSYFYFDHSYYVEPKDKDVVMTTTDYGIEFTSMVWKEDIYGVQFHPEKSQEYGLRMLKNFVSL